MAFRNAIRALLRKPATAQERRRALVLDGLMAVVGVVLVASGALAGLILVLAGAGAAARTLWGNGPGD